MSDGANDDILDPSAGKARGFRTNLLRSRIDERNKRESMRAESMPSEEELAREREAEEHERQEASSASDAFRSHYKGRPTLKNNQEASSPLARFAKFSMIGVLVTGALGMAYFTLLKEPEKVARIPEKRTPLRPPKNGGSKPEKNITIPKETVKSPTKPKSAKPPRGTRRPSPTRQSGQPKARPVRRSSGSGFGNVSTRIAILATEDMVDAPAPLALGPDFLESSVEHEQIWKIAETFLAETSKAVVDFPNPKQRKRGFITAEEKAVNALIALTTDEEEAPLVFQAIEDYIYRLKDHPFQLMLARALAARGADFAMGAVQDLVANDTTNTDVKRFIINSLPDDSQADTLIREIWDRVSKDGMRLELLNVFDRTTNRRADNADIRLFICELARKPSESLAVRAEAIRMIGRRGKGGAGELDALSSVAGNSSNQMALRSLAVAVLIHVGRAEALPALNNLAANGAPENKSLRSTIIEESENLGSAAIPLLRRISESDPAEELRARAGALATKLEVSGG